MIKKQIEEDFGKILRNFVVKSSHEMIWSR